jgi:hypothetical protein
LIQHCTRRRRRASIRRLLLIDQRQRDADHEGHEDEARDEEYEADDIGHRHSSIASAARSSA